MLVITLGIIVGLMVFTAMVLVMLAQAMSSASAIPTSIPSDDTIRKVLKHDPSQKFDGKIWVIRDE